MGTIALFGPYRALKGPGPIEPFAGEEVGGE